MDEKTTTNDKEKVEGILSVDKLKEWRREKRKENNPKNIKRPSNAFLVAYVDHFFS